MRWLALALLATFALMLIACSGMKVEGECTYVREVKTSYHCETGSKLEHIRLSPTAPD
jgi:hypothetical protein